eukprot:6178339-Pleurochrysis_carterae.AAC.1
MEGRPRPPELGYRPAVGSLPGTPVRLRRALPPSPAAALVPPPAPSALMTAAAPHFPRWLCRRRKPASVARLLVGARPAAEPCIRRPAVDPPAQVPSLARPDTPL